MTGSNKLTFKYLGLEFTAFSKQNAFDWVIDHDVEFGKFKHLQISREEFAFQCYNHTEFYQAAATVGADKFNVFKFGDWEVSPCEQFLLGFKRS